VCWHWGKLGSRKGFNIIISAPISHFSKFPRGPLHKGLSFLRRPLNHYFWGAPYWGGRAFGVSIPFSKGFTGPPINSLWAIPPKFFCLGWEFFGVGPHLLGTPGLGSLWELLWKTLLCFYPFFKKSSADFFFKAFFCPRYFGGLLFLGGFFPVVSLEGNIYGRL